MQAIGQRDTAPELALRSAHHRLGLRFRIDIAPIPGRRRADVVFRSARVAVFVDGCFWHECPIHGSRPKTNATFWAQKIERNLQRDTDTNHLLIEASWTPLPVWEHELPNEAAQRVARPLRQGA